MQVMNFQPTAAREERMVAGGFDDFFTDMDEVDGIALIGEDSLNPLFREGVGRVIIGPNEVTGFDLLYFFERRLYYESCIQYLLWCRCA